MDINKNIHIIYCIRKNMCEKEILNNESTIIID